MLFRSGVMDAEEAQLLVNMGAKALVVSNHGGRILDYSPATATILPKIVSQINGQVPVWVDGGVQSGLDVYKMLALGADGVLIGRKFAHSVMCDPVCGVRDFGRKIKEPLA